MEVSDLVKQIRTMNEVAESDRPKMSEHDFAKYLLPLLIDHQNAGDVNLNLWLDIAGNPHRSIDVFDVKNQLLFTVPPILARVPSIDRPLDTQSVSVSELAYMYGRKAEVEHPAAADIWLEGALRNHNIPADQEQILDYMRNWIKIYHRYNLPIDKLIGKDDKLAKLVDSKAIPQSTDSDDTISGEFDDF